MPKICRKSVDQAIELLQSHRTSGKCTKDETEEDKKLQKIDMQCRIIHCSKRHRRPLTSFSKNLILSEIKSHVARRDWSQARNLFLSLLRRSTEIEPVIWRYAFIIALYSNVDNLSNVSQFLEMCIGSLDSESNVILKNLLLLSHQK